MAWGLDVTYRTEKFDPEMLRTGHMDYSERIVLLVGYVDNANARKSLHEALKQNNHDSLPHIWWLDGGNHDEEGQVLLGSAYSSVNEVTFASGGLSLTIDTKRWWDANESDYYRNWYRRMETLDEQIEGLRISVTCKPDLVKK
jgi:hypothetical protein